MLTSRGAVTLIISQTTLVETKIFQLLLGVLPWNFSQAIIILGGWLCRPPDFPPASPATSKLFYANTPNYVLNIIHTSYITTVIVTMKTWWCYHLAQSSSVSNYHLTELLVWFYTLSLVETMTGTVKCLVYLVSFCLRQRSSQAEWHQSCWGLHQLCRSSGHRIPGGQTRKLHIEG